MQIFFESHFLQFQILGQTTLAMLLGALIGLDREFAKKPAGLRTHMLVAGASALIMKLAEISVSHFEKLFISEHLRADPIRVFVAVVTGISFLGAGTIIRQQEGRQVEGLTTAAALLFSAVIGMSVGLSQYILAIGATLIAVIILWTLAKIEHWISSR
jgi:putative Mg2+ transporter-C (MgtC) family protein